MAVIREYALSKILKQYRETHFIDDSKEYKQITISKYTGVQFRETKNGKQIGRKRQFFVNLKKYPHTIIFTRQGVKDGSIGLAPDEVDGCIATENMPMFSVDDKKIIPGLLQVWLKSNEFKSQVERMTPTGSAQKAIHERDLLKIKINIPERIVDQDRLFELFSKKNEGLRSITVETEKQNSYLSQLRQSILQEAIEGKLTAKWRKENPVRKGDPNYDAGALLSKIKNYWETSKKITRSMKNGLIAEPLLEPNGWIKTNIDGIGIVKVGGTPSRNNPSLWKGNIPWVSSGEVANCEINNTTEFITKIGSNESAAKLLPSGTVLVAMIGQGKTRGQAAVLRIAATTNQNVCAIIIDHGLIAPRFLFYYFLSRYEESRSFASGGNQPALNGEKIGNFNINLPSFKEQLIIVEKVDSLLNKVDELEKQITERKENTEELMQAVLREAFEGTLQTQQSVNVKQTTENICRLKSSTDLQAGVFALIIDAHSKNKQYEKTLGRVKAEKINHIIEAHFGLDFERAPVKLAAGPADFKKIQKVEHRAEKKNWFKAVKGKDRVFYSRLSSFNYLIKDINTDLPEKINDVKNVIKLFVPLDTQAAEIAATTYAAWGNLLSAQHQPTDKEIVYEARNNWTDSKLNIPEERFYKCIEWLRQHQLIPCAGVKKVTNRK